MKYFEEIRKELNDMPVVNTHEHYCGDNKIKDNVFELFAGYDLADFISTASNQKEISNFVKLINDKDQSFDDKYKIFKDVYEKCSHTGYLKGTLRGVRELYNIEDFSYENLKKLEKLIKEKKDNEYYNKKYNIKYRIVDLVTFEAFMALLNDDITYNENERFALVLPNFHTHIHNGDMLFRLNQFLGRQIVCLDDYLEAFEKMLKKSKEKNVVCIKDQSAYNRSIEIGNPSKEAAEKEFNQMVYNTYKTYGTDETKNFSDYFLHYTARLAKKYDMPFQMHTGHMARNQSQIKKTNAVLLNKFLNLHRDVKFSLFHGNWPYFEEYMFLGKNNQNVHLDLCWVNSIDPIYSIELYKRAFSALAESKILAFGADTTNIEHTIGYLEQTKDNISIALSMLCDYGMINTKEAKILANKWLYENPMKVYGL